SMLELPSHQPVDYLIVGHVAVDITPTGVQLGGTVSYSALTARALGLRVGIVTSSAADAPLQALDGIQIVNIPAEQSTTFENIKTESGRRQILHHQAVPILLEHIPQVWRTASIIHLAPIAGELDPSLAEQLSGKFLGITPQGWMRTWDENGQVAACVWENSEQALGQAGAVVMSVEDVNRDLEQVEAMAHQTRILCLTEGEAGAVLYWNGDRRRFRPVKVQEVDATGAGDIFAAAFFMRYYNTRDPWEATRFATNLAARSVTRVGLNGIPTAQEIEECLMEVLL
ncbi:MAG TPA: PfkB family carbohydrate kinase, partial [Anaerolineales bacterium]|nr:PfkB family carbohydrate kinase [Anaerolineales bacterium]